MTHYIYETHCHSSEGSACSYVSGSELVHAYRNKGYSGLILTDHFFNGNTAVSSNLPWNERVSHFMLGYESALDAANTLNASLTRPASSSSFNEEFHVFFGFEYCFHGTEFLIYGLGKDFLLSYPQMLSWSVTTFFDYVHEAGGFITHAHPFREASYLSNVRLYPEKVDAVEVVNKSHTKPSFDKKALAYANAHNLLKTSGSDTHRLPLVSGGGIIFNRPMPTIQHLLDAFRNGESTYIP
jgi:hypothetical protein